MLTISAMAPTTMTRKRGSMASAVAVLGGVAIVALKSSAFIAAPQAQGAPAVENSRRALLASAIVAAAPQLFPAQAHAAEAPPNIEVNGIEGRNNGANGQYSVVAGKDINSRPVYKRDGADFYLTFNDCGSFQIGKEPAGACEGFAQDIGKGKWSVDGTEQKVKVKPVAKKEKKKALFEEKPRAGEKKEAKPDELFAAPAAPAPAASNPFTSFFQSQGNNAEKGPEPAPAPAPAPGPAGEVEQLEQYKGVKEKNWVFSKDPFKSSASDYTADYMTMDEDEMMSSSKLEGRLGAVKYQGQEGSGTSKPGLGMTRVPNTKK